MGFTRTNGSNSVRIYGQLKPVVGLELSEANGLAGGIDVIKYELEVLKNAYIDVIQLEITTENLPVFKDLRKKLY